MMCITLLQDDYHILRGRTNELSILVSLEHLQENMLITCQCRLGSWRYGNVCNVCTNYRMS